MTPDKNVVEGQVVEVNTNRPEMWIAIGMVGRTWVTEVLSSSKYSAISRFMDAYSIHPSAVVRVPAESAPPPESDAVEIHVIQSWLANVRGYLTKANLVNALPSLDAAMEKIDALRAAPKPEVET